MFWERNLIKSFLSKIEISPLRRRGRQFGKVCLILIGKNRFFIDLQLPFFVFLIRPKASSYQRPSTKNTTRVPTKRKEVNDADAD